MERLADLFCQEENERAPEVVDATEAERARIAAIGDLSYPEFLNAFFGHVASKELAERHHRLWRWFSALRKEKRPKPRIDPWPRGSGKSTTAELGCAFVGCRLTRRFVLFVSATQDQADQRVTAVASLFETLGIGRAVGRYGNSRGWRGNRLRTAHGFNVAAFGLDKAVRGIKLDQFRPDLIVFDDIDNRHDSPKTVRKKVESITTNILPAGSSDCAILFLQNLIHEGGVVCQLYDGRAKFLLDREVIELEPAVTGLETKIVPNEAGANVHRIVAGTATWPEGQSIETCEKQINDWSLEAFLREAQHEVKGTGGYIFNRDAFQYVDHTQLPRFVRLVRAWDLAATQGGGDYTVGVLMGITPNGRIYILDVKRYQFSPERVNELLLATARRDAAGEVWEDDEYDLFGRLTRRGELRFRFNGSVRIHLPQDPAAAGKSDAAQKRELLKGFDVIVRTVSGPKATRAQNYASKVNDRNVYLVRGAWNLAFTSEHGDFKEDETHEYDDQVDAGSDGHNELARGRKKAASRSG
jgi:predicted phage terminase large subunit-like protein